MLHSKSLQGHIVVVTGARGALGSVLSRVLLEMEAIVSIPEIDVTNEEEVNAFYGQFENLYASIHLVGGYSQGGPLETSGADFDKMMAINAKSAFLCSKAAIKAMMKTPYAGGRIVNVVARNAIYPEAGADALAYTMSKASVAAMTKALAIDLNAHKIYVNAVAPSVMDTPANRKAMPNEDFSRWPKVIDVAEEIAFLASPDNKLISGALTPLFGLS